MTMTIHLIHHADVIRPIKSTLRSFGVHKQDLEDGVAEVQTRTLEHLQGKALPEGIRAMGRAVHDHRPKLEAQ